MNPLEVVFWNVLFWALYLPIAVILLLLGAQGHPFGVVACGLMGSVILSVFLAFQDDLLFESYTPVRVTIKEESAKPEPKIRERAAPEVKDEKMEVKSPKDEPAEAVEGVQPDDKEEIEFAVGEEPEPRMRTDVSLNEFDADDDDSFSKCD